jgi:hypothetical protein
MYAGVVKLVDTRGLGPRTARCGGSSPLPGTIYIINRIYHINLWFFDIKKSLLHKQGFK